MSRPRRGYSDAEVDEYVKQQAERRADERLAHPERWVLVWDEWSEFFGPTWREIKEAE